jgi:adenylate kinase family enzyme
VTGLPVVHLDKLFWKSGWVQSAREEFYGRLQDALEGSAWIMDGNYGSSLPLRLQYCDQVICFDLPRAACMWGILSRAVRYRGQNRPDMGDGCPEKIDLEFIRYTWRFNKTEGSRLRELLDGCGKPVVSFRSHREARKYLKVFGYDNA